MTRPLTDREIADRTGIPTGSRSFDAAARFARSSGLDRTFNEMPELMCPHCGAEWSHLGATEIEAGEVQAGRSINCPACHRVIYVEHMDVTIAVTLSTEPPKTSDGGLCQDPDS